LSPEFLVTKKLEAPFSYQKFGQGFFPLFSGAPRIDDLNGSIEGLRNGIRLARGAEIHEDQTWQWLFRGPSD